MDPQPGDICLFYNARGLARLITWFTRSRFYHVGLYAGEGCVVEARVTGVIRRDLRAEGEHDFIVIPAPKGCGPQALRWAEEQLGDGYDIPWLLELVLERMFKNLHINCKPTHNRFSCSELVLCAYRETGTNLLPSLSPSAVIPGDFAQLLSDNG